MKYFISSLFVAVFTSCAIFGIESIEFRVPEKTDTTENQIAENVVKEPAKEVWRCNLLFVKTEKNQVFFLPYLAQEYTLIFYNNGTYRGIVTCNGGVAGKYKMDRNTVQFVNTVGVRTRVYCPDLIITESVEKALYKVNNFVMKNGKLSLLQDGEILMEYRIVE